MLVPAGEAGHQLALLNGCRKARRRIWSIITAHRSAAGNKGMRIGVGRVNRRPGIRRRANVQLVCIRGEISHSVGARRAGAIRPARSRRAGRWTACQRSVARPFCSVERA